jgi:energy-coupling factor transporter ATP-binding protein EcfA2
MTAGDGGFVMITGEPGSGKSVALRLLAERLRELRDVVVGTVDHPQSRVSDFYRELGDIFGVPFPPHNRWAGFKTLRARWGEHISTTLMRPVLIVDEAQEMLATVFGELRVLTSKDFDLRALLCVVMACDGRLPERLRGPGALATRQPHPPSPELSDGDPKQDRGAVRRYAAARVAGPRGLCLENATSGDSAASTSPIGARSRSMSSSPPQV